MILEIKDQTGAGFRRICHVLNLSRSSFYHAAHATPSEIVDLDLGQKIEAIFLEHRRRYGYRRIHRELQEAGVVCAECRVRRLMKERGLQAISPRQFIPRTSDGRADAPSPNLLQDRGLPEQPNQIWTGDITYIPTEKGWRYLAIILDLCSRKVVGWSLGNHMRSELVCEALDQALQSRGSKGELIFHSDRGSQYGSGRYRQQLEEAGITQSMSRRANPYDNAWTESFMGTLKKEMLQGGCFIDEEDARTELFSYINGYYNTRRRHSALDYQSPENYEINTYQN